MSPPRYSHLDEGERAVESVAMLSVKGWCSMDERISTAAKAPHHHYSVRLAGLSAWEEHLESYRLAQRSAAEPRAMGLTDVHILDEESGECLE